MISLACVAALATLFQATPRATQVLPLTRLRLYESGVGYFERTGTVDVDAHPSLPVPRGHLDDALKTLVILSDANSASIGAVSFKSSLSGNLGRLLANLPANESTQLSYADVLKSLRGLDVDVRTTTERLKGRLLDVTGPYDQSPATAAKAEDSDARAHRKQPTYAREPEYTLLVQTEQGAVLRIRTADLVQIQPQQALASTLLDGAMQATSARAAQEQETLVLAHRGKMALKLGYIAETPVWRSSYRIVLRKAHADLQAWALIHNDSEEDWRGVRVELVNGEPTSFLYPLAVPRYAVRELRTPEEQLSTVPQLLNATADRLWGDFYTEGVGESVGYGGLGISGQGAGGAGSGIGTLNVSTRQATGPQQPMLGDLAQFAQASGEESQALFTYRLPTAINLDARHSALVPVVSSQVDAEAMTWINDKLEAMTGARIRNSTKQTLPAGPTAFFDDSGFVGESIIKRLKPDEQIYTLFGVDLDVDSECNKTQVSQNVLNVTLQGPSLEQHMAVVSNVEFVFKNRSGNNRRLVVELPVQRNARITTDAKLDYDRERERALAHFELSAGTTATHTMLVTEGSVHKQDAAAMTAQDFQTLAHSEKLPERKRSLLLKAAKLRSQHESSLQQHRSQAQRGAQILGEIARLRDDVQALGQAGVKSDAAREISERLARYESTLESLARQQRSAELEQQRLHQELLALLQQL